MQPTLLNVMHTLGNMNQDNIETEDESLQVGVFIADSAMFQRMKPEPEAPDAGKYDGTDPEAFQEDGDTELLDFSPFYGLALPLLKHGIPVRPVQLDNVRRYPHYLAPYRVLLLSYEFMKPEYSDIHFALAQWVQDGGALVYVGDDSDPYHNIRAWWNDDLRSGSSNQVYHSPREHLFEQLGLETKQQGIQHSGKGLVNWLCVHPAVCSSSKTGADQLRQSVREAVDKIYGSHKPWKSKNYFKIKRGPYIIASVLEESVSEEALVIPGPVIDLFDPVLRVLQEVRLAPGEQALLYDVTAGRPQHGKVKLISASSRIENLTITDAGFQFAAKGPANLQATARLYCPAEPVAVCCMSRGEEAAAVWEWDPKSQTVLLRYEHGSENEIKVQASWSSETLKA
ncbi:hypothetical protein [Paenibacillus terreus]